FKEQGGSLLAEEAKLNYQKDMLLADLPYEVKKAYDLACDKGAGIAVAELDGDMCSACKYQFMRGRLIEMMREAPVSVCNSCGRLLIIKKD
ncbi:MAG: hypothetical protein J6Y65_02685, partial [Eggerthellaceae bacterium]|nr:hypothetical protein [Eggerthellaceae bacterium]